MRDNGTVVRGLGVTMLWRDRTPYAMPVGANLIRLILSRGDAFALKATFCRVPFSFKKKEPKKNLKPLAEMMRINQVGITAANAA